MTDPLLGWILCAAILNVDGWIAAIVALRLKSRALSLARLRIASLQERLESVPLSWRLR